MALLQHILGAIWVVIQKWSQMASITSYLVPFARNVFALGQKQAPVSSMDASRRGDSE